MPAATVESLELQIFPSEERLYIPNTLWNIPNAPEETALRMCRLPTHPEGIKQFGLTKILDLADKELSHLSNTYGMPHVQPEWGLYPVDAVLAHPDTNRRGAIDIREAIINGESLLPSGFLLAARVIVIDEKGKLTQGERKDLDMEIELYMRERIESQNPYLSDLSYTQFVFGAARNSALESTAEQTWLVDIEPRMSRPPQWSIQN